MSDGGERRALVAVPVAPVNGEPRISSPQLSQRLNGHAVDVLEVREDWIFAGDYSMEAGTAAASFFSSLKEMPTAVFAGNDEMGIGLISGLRSAGIECPRDISVLGFDDISISEHYAPALTTMRQPREKIGRIAAETLINILEGNVVSSDPVRVLLRSELIVRESTAPPREK